MIPAMDSGSPLFTAIGDGRRAADESDDSCVQLYPDGSHLPFSLRIWGETQYLKFLDIELKEVSPADHDMPERIRRLFPEAEVRTL